VAGIAVALGFGALYVAMTDPGTPAFPTSDLVRGLAGVLAFAPLGTLVAARVPRQAAGWLMLGVGFSGGAAVFAATLAHRLLVEDPSSSAGSFAYWLNTWLWVPSYVLVPTWLFLVLPDGVLPGRAWRRVLVLVALCVLGVLVAVYRDDEAPRDRLRTVIGATVLVAAALAVLAMTGGYDETLVNPLPSHGRP
jgi:hypothetical protein